MYHPSLARSKRSGKDRGTMWSSTRRMSVRSSIARAAATWPASQHPWCTASWSGSGVTWLTASWCVFVPDPAMIYAKQLPKKPGHREEPLYCPSGTFCCPVSLAAPCPSHKWCLGLHTVGPYVVASRASRASMSGFSARRKGLPSVKLLSSVVSHGVIEDPRGIHVAIAPLIPNGTYSNAITQALAVGLVWLAIHSIVAPASCPTLYGPQRHCSHHPIVGGHGHEVVNKATVRDRSSVRSTVRNGS